jgi:hypothetical protein
MNLRFSEDVRVSKSKFYIPGLNVTFKRLHSRLLRYECRCRFSLAPFMLHSALEFLKLKSKRAAQVIKMVDKV